MREENPTKVAHTRARKRAKMERKVKDLNNRYKDNKYEMKEIINNRGYKLQVIKRTAGTRPHKKSKKVRR